LLDVVGYVDVWVSSAVVCVVVGLRMVWVLLG